MIDSGRTTTASADKRRRSNPSKPLRRSGAAWSNTIGLITALLTAAGLVFDRQVIIDRAPELATLLATVLFVAGLYQRRALRNVGRAIAETQVYAQVIQKQTLRRNDPPQTPAATAARGER